MKNRQKLGECLFCGSPIYEYSHAWACSNKECRTIIYKDDRFFAQFLKSPISKSKAVTLMTGGKVHLKNVKIYDGVHDIEVSLSLDRSGKYENYYVVQCLDRLKKDKKNSDGSGDTLTGFDILNGG